MLEPAGEKNCDRSVRCSCGVTPLCNEALGFRGVVWELEKRLATRALFHYPLVILSKEPYCE